MHAAAGDKLTLLLSALLLQHFMQLRRLPLFHCCCTHHLPAPLTHPPTFAASTHD
jgi:hypothetical protein